MAPPPSEHEPVVLSEYGETTISLTPAQERFLRSVVGSRLVVQPQIGEDRWSVKATAHVGTVVVPGLTLLVKPKVSTSNLFHLLEAGGDALDIGDEQFEYDRSDDLLAAFSTFYARHLERAVSLGVPRAYVGVAERLHTIRGRIDLPAQRAMVGLPLPAHCQFDEYTTDIALNRMLREAAVRLAHVPNVTHQTRAVLIALARRFEDAGPAQPGDLATPTLFTRLNSHCRPAERLARMVLDAQTLQYSPGSSNAGVFLINMNAVFEEFVEARLRHYLRGRLSVVGQFPGALDDEDQVGIRPDLAFEGIDGHLLYIADSKYKVVTDGYARNPDYYQLAAYLTALGLDEGLLVYCQHDGNVPPTEITIKNSAQRINTWAVRLDGRPSDVEHDLQNLADHVSVRAQGEQLTSRQQLAG